MADVTIAERLERRLREPLPGIDAQRSMAPINRLQPDYDPDPPGANHAAVLLIVTARHELVFIRRAADGRAHSGQIAFPGGARESADRDLAATALRETHEEIGVAPELVTLLGALSPLYIGVSNFTVYPFVGWADALPGFVPQRGEVDEVIVVPIERLPSSCGELDVPTRAQVRLVPCYRYGPVEVWGATAMMTAEFLAVWGDATEATAR